MREESSWAYCVIRDIPQTKIETANFRKGISLCSAMELKRLQGDFPDVVGKTINYENLENVLTLVFDKIKEEASAIENLSSYARSRISNLEDFMCDGKLRADHNTESSLDDLANKVFSCQAAVRENI